MISEYEYEYDCPHCDSRQTGYCEAYDDPCHECEQCFSDNELMIIWGNESDGEPYTNQVYTEEEWNEYLSRKKS